MPRSASHVFCVSADFLRGSASCFFALFFVHLSAFGHCILPFAPSPSRHPFSFKSLVLSFFIFCFFSLQEASIKRTENGCLIFCKRNTASRLARKNEFSKAWLCEKVDFGHSCPYFFHLNAYKIIFARTR